MSISRLNGTLAVANYGSVQVSVERIEWGIQFTNDTDNTRMDTAFYAKQVVATPFTIHIACATHEEYTALGNWLQGYGNRAAAGTPQVGSMRVTVPSRGFDKMGVPSSGVTFGDNRTTTVHRMTLTFVGTADPIGSFGTGNIKAPTAISQFSIPDDPTHTLPYFYPGGTQLSGVDMGDDLLYDAGSLDFTGF